MLIYMIKTDKVSPIAWILHPLKTFLLFERKQRMKLTEKINLFVERKPYKKNGEEKIYYKLSTSIATKTNDGDYLRMPLDIIVNDKKYPESLLAKLDPNFMYTANVINGWLMVDKYFNKDGLQVKKLVIYVDEMKLTGQSPIDQEKRKKALANAKGNADGQKLDLPF